MKVLDLFPTPVLITKIEDVFSEEIEFLKTIPDTNELKSNPEREEGPGYDYVLKYDNLKNLRTTLNDLGNHFSRKYLSIESKLAFQQSWVNNKTCGTDFHRHKNCVVSGVFYFGDEYSKYFVFHKPDTHSGYMLEPEVIESEFDANPYTRTQTAILPEKNMVILFPSYVPHGVVQTREDDTVLHQSLAFNLVPKNNLGHRHRLNQFNYVVEEKDLKNA